MKKIKEKKFIDKRLLESGIVLAAAALGLISLLFTVVRGGIEYLLDSEFYFSNGTNALLRYPD